MTLKEVEALLYTSCEDLRWREKQDGVERLLNNLSWWLDVKGQHLASVTISGLANEFKFNRDATDAVEHLLHITDSTSVSEIIDRWGSVEAFEAKEDDQ